MKPKKLKFTLFCLLSIFCVAADEGLEEKPEMIREIDYWRGNSSSSPGFEREERIENTSVKGNGKFSRYPGMPLNDSSMSTLSSMTSAENAVGNLPKMTDATTKFPKFPRDTEKLRNFQDNSQTFDRILIDNLQEVNELISTTEGLQQNPLKTSSDVFADRNIAEFSNNYSDAEKILQTLNSEIDDSVFTTETNYPFNDDASSADSVLFAVISPAEGIKEVENLTVHAVTSDSIQLNWLSSARDSNATRIYFSIEICEGETCRTINETKTQHTFNDLKPCTLYKFSVKLVTKDHESEGISITQRTSNDVKDIIEVQNLSANDYGIDFIKLKWEKPDKIKNCKVKYEIVQCDSSKKSCKSSTTVESSYEANNLRPCTVYFFTVKTINGNKTSDGVHISQETGSPQSSEPRLPKYETGDTPNDISLTIRWEKPEVNATCIKYYRITIEPGKIVHMTSLMSITINGLEACSSYKVDINAVNRANVSSNTITINEARTASAVTTPPILNDPVPVTSDSTISISWIVKRQPRNNCNISAVITFCNYTQSTAHGYTRTNGTSRTLIKENNSPLIVVNVTVENLSPYTDYLCWAVTENEAGNSSLSVLINATTLQDVPSPPVLTVKNITNSYFSFVWQEPEYLAGVLTEYEILLNWKPLYPIPDWCTFDETTNNTISNISGDALSYEYLNGKAFTNYTVKIRASTSAGWGIYSDPIFFETHPGVPGPATNLSYAINPTLQNPNVLDTMLRWSLPCSINGKLESFNISVYGERNGYKTHAFFLTINVTNSVSKYDVYSKDLDELKGEYSYTFEVMAKVQGVEDYGQSANTTGVLYPAGLPPQPDEDYIRSITIDPDKAKRTTTSASLLLPLFPNVNGDVKFYSIMVAEIGFNEASQQRFDITKENWPNISSWEDAMLADYKIAYQATRPFWDPSPTNVADYGHMKAVKYVIGEDTTCKEISQNSDNRLYCNGPLKPDTTYHVRMRAFTYGGYTDSIAFEIRTNAELNIAIVVGIVFGILFLGIFTTMMLIVRKCSPQAVLRRFLHSDMPGSPVPAPFSRKKFLSHCQQLVDNPGKLSNEFRLLQTLSVDLQMPANTACLQANRKKNRYSDILPYDFSRVKLEVIDNDPNTDYINASFIRGYTGDDEYIACQGPKEETTYDFWRMVDQYEVKTIVMLTQLVEKGKEKCHQYFPAIMETFRYENMTIRCASELDFRTYTHRTLVLQKGNKKRNIIHLHFKDWPDHDVPEDFDPMINFCQVVRKNITASKGLVVIHCSAGIGRTGTLIAIDILLQHLRDNRKLDVFGTVYRLRHHRINMVQRETQYAYIYNCIKQVLKNPYFLKTYKPPPVFPLSEKKIKENELTNLNLVDNHI
ncbi:receptor-type tyrosine-protein phosphatase H [Prorops nasuta]|uniref:receptor-type tyrosine-protein phosphatase H n=1 Tax=Prorops nasuta TaxID=863751 RepID=UPI0034CD8F8C